MGRLTFDQGSDHQSYRMRWRLGRRWLRLLMLWLLLLMLELLPLTHWLLHCWLELLLLMHWMRLK
jgi:hypothetical protein